jgi:hypothetical protein
VAATIALGLAWAYPAATDEPKFAYGKKEAEQKVPDWTASLTAGFGAATGNAQNLNLSGAASVARRFHDNMLSLDASAAIARSTLPIAVASPNPGVAELSSITQTTSEAWNTRVRYDRFFDLNALYAFVSAGGDVPAGKQFVGGAQVGYARALYKAGKDELELEAGIDYTYQHFVTGSPDLVNIASLRGFLGYVGNPDDIVTYSASVEWLGNMTEETRPTGSVSPFDDNRVDGKLGLTWKIFGNGNLGFRFHLLYDSVPAPRPLPSLPAGLAWPPNYQPLADRLDTLTEIVIVYKLNGSSSAPAK